MSIDPGINWGCGCVREGGGAPGPDLGNHLVNRHGRVNVNPGCMFTGGGGSLGLKPSTEVFNKKSPTCKAARLQDIAPQPWCLQKARGDVYINILIYIYIYIYIGARFAFQPEP